MSWRDVLAGDAIGGRWERSGGWWHYCRSQRTDQAYACGEAIAAMPDATSSREPLYVSDPVCAKCRAWDRWWKRIDRRTAGRPWPT